jgi:hypothetical protein
MIRRPKVGEVYKHSLRPVTVEVKAVTPGFVSLEVSDETGSMHWRETLTYFQRFWRLVEKTETAK